MCTHVNVDMTKTLSFGTWMYLKFSPGLLNTENPLPPSLTTYFPSSRPTDKYEILKLSLNSPLYRPNSYDGNFFFMMLLDGSKAEATTTTLPVVR